jgi:REP element-mobilizing transposase RayT
MAFDMPQSLSAIYVHIVFSTKDRIPFLKDPSLRSRTHAYLAGIASQHQCPCLIVGGVEDHVHMLSKLAKTGSASDLVRDLKKASTSWLRGDGSGGARFAWQAGYGAFSSDAANLARLRHYIGNQEEHHRKTTFKDEFRAICREFEVELDERYAWH